MNKILFKHVFPVVSINEERLLIQPYHFFPPVIRSSLQRLKTRTCFDVLSFFFRKSVLVLMTFILFLCKYLCNSIEHNDYDKSLGWRNRFFC